MPQTKTSKTPQKNEAERISHPVKVAEVKKNDLMAFVYYTTVRKVQGENVDVHNVDDDVNFSVQGAKLIERGFSADQFAEEVKVSKTRAAEILISSHNRPFTVCFEKQDGDDRTLRGRLVHPEPLLGRSMVEDLDLSASEHRLRQVDHRTIKYLIVEGVKYVVK